MVHRYDEHQKVMRMEALKTTRKHLAKKFMKVFRLFRHKKHGEPLDDKQTTWKLDDSADDLFFFNKKYIPEEITQEEQMIMKRIEDLKKQLVGEKEKSPGRAISDLHTVNENYDDEDDEDDMEAIDPNLNPNKFVRS